MEVLELLVHGRPVITLSQILKKILVFFSIFQTLLILSLNIHCLVLQLLYPTTPFVALLLINNHWHSYYRWHFYLMRRVLHHSFVDLSIVSLFNYKNTLEC